jgi:hypothetical protein
LAWEDRPRADWPDYRLDRACSESASRHAASTRAAGIVHDIVDDIDAVGRYAQIGPLGLSEGLFS